MQGPIAFLLLFMATLGFAMPGTALAFSGGISGYSGNPATNGGATCTLCHSGGIVPSVSLSGPNSVAPGSTHTYTLTISGGQEVAGGLDVSVTGGMLTVSAAGTKLLNNEITHTASKPAANGEVTFSFDWTAPVSGSVTMYAAGNSVDGQSGAQGDNSAATQLSIAVETMGNQPPTADPAGPYSGAVGETITFDGSGSSDADGFIVAYDWDFGDGNSGTGVNPIHAFTMAGNYTVSLTVTDDMGATDTATTSAMINGGVSQPLNTMEKLGKALFFDTNLSTPKGQSCAVCHGPEAGWTGPLSEINAHGAVYEGAKHNLFGNRKPPSSAYATPSPVFHMTSPGEFMGGNFWDGRATGEILGNPAADQAQGPFLNPLEQANPNMQVICQRIKQSRFAEELVGESYDALFAQVFGPGSFDCRPRNLQATYDYVGLAIAAYEGSSEVNAYSAKFDAWQAGMVELTEQEMMGWQLFNGKALCSVCHLTTPGPNGEPPLFTDFRYHNLGVPKNPENPFYTQHKKFNPDGENWIDPGLAGFLETRPEYQEFAEQNYGKHRTPTLRNADLRPDETFVKAFMHNGVFKSLEEVVAFYNSRDTGMWPPPEVDQNLSPLLGDLGLSAQEQAALVAFMKTLNDGFMSE